MEFIKNYMTANSKRETKIQIDFVWSTQKGMSSLFPLYEMAVSRDWNSKFYKVKKQWFLNRHLVKSLSNTIIIAYDQPLYRLWKSGWSGKYIYIEHGLGAIKYYTYKYNFFHKAELLFYPGPVFQRKMDAINPAFKNGLLGGYPKMDDLINKKINRENMLSELDLDPDKPVVLFAPSWGGKYSKQSGIWNADYLKNIPNLIIVPHSQDYHYAKQVNAVIPPKKDGINPYLHLADIVVSDVSSVLAEAAILDKPVVQLKLPFYPGCFPEKDRRKKDVWLSEDFIKQQEIITDLKKRPFKIAYLDEDWIMGEISEPEKINEMVALALADLDKYKKERKYWGEQSCYKCDGKTSLRIAMMIEHFQTSGNRKQIGELN